MDCTKILDKSIALACNHCGILCIELHILYPPSCQDKPKLPSSVNTWDGLLLTTQPLGSCWCACCCGLWIDVPSEGGNSLPLRGLRSFSSIERPSTLAGGAKKSTLPARQQSSSHLHQSEHTGNNKDHYFIDMILLMSCHVSRVSKTWDLHCFGLPNLLQHIGLVLQTHGSNCKPTRHLTGKFCGCHMSIQQLKMLKHLI